MSVPSIPIRAVLILVAAAGATAVDLPGIPGPAPLGDETLRLGWNNDAFGPGGGGKSDDYRTNELSAAWTRGSWVVGLDHSILTSTNPSGAPVVWGLPDPFYLARRGQARRDELTASLGLRLERTGEAWQGWAQAGAGFVIAGDLGGEVLQNATHVVLRNQTKDLPYEESAPRADPLAYAGLGGSLGLGGPLRLAAGALGAWDAGGWLRSHAEVLLVAGGAGGGMWMGWRHALHRGDPASVVVAVTADHEAGPELVAGFAIDPGPGMRLAVETGRDLQTDAQEGTLSLAWLPGSGAMTMAANATPWQGRVGLVGGDSRCGGRGIDYALARAWDAPWSPSLRVGLRDQEIAHPYDFDIAARRRLAWAGAGVRPELARRGAARLVADAEAGLGCRWSRVASHGFVDVDAGDQAEFVEPVVRAAAGLGALWRPGNGPEFGVLLLVEGTLAQAHDVILTTRDPFSGVARERSTVPVEGAAWCPILALVADWRW